MSNKSLAFYIENYLKSQTNGLLTIRSLASNCRISIEAMQDIIDRLIRFKCIEVDESFDGVSNIDSQWRITIIHHNDDWYDVIGNVLLNYDTSRN